MSATTVPALLEQWGASRGRKLASLAEFTDAVGAAVQRETWKDRYCNEAWIDLFDQHRSDPRYTSQTYW